MYIKRIYTLYTKTYCQNKNAGATNKVVQARPVKLQAKAVW